MRGEGKGTRGVAVRGVLSFEKEGKGGNKSIGETGKAENWF